MKRLDAIEAFAERERGITTLTTDPVVRQVLRMWPTRESPDVWRPIIAGQAALKDGQEKLLTPYGLLRADVRVGNDPNGNKHYRRPLVLEMDVPPHDPSDLATVAEVIRGLFAKVSLLCASISFETGYPVWWVPSQPCRFDDRENSETNPNVVEGVLGVDHPDSNSYLVVDQDFVHNRVAPLHSILTTLRSDSFRQALQTALGLLWEGGRSRGASGFVAYWNAIEFLAGYLYGALPGTAVNRPSRSDRDLQILKLLLDAKSSNASHTAQEIARLMRPSPRQKIKAVAELLSNESSHFMPDGATLVRRLFSQPKSGGPSLYDIRNEIAHGRFARITPDESGHYYAETQLMHAVARAFYIWTLRAAADLDDQIAE